MRPLPDREGWAQDRAQPLGAARGGIGCETANPFPPPNSAGDKAAKVMGKNPVSRGWALLRHCGSVRYGTLFRSLAR